MITGDGKNVRWADRRNSTECWEWLSNAGFFVKVGFYTLGFIDWLTVWEWWDHYRHPAGQWTSQVCWQILKLSLILKIVLHIAIDAQHAARPQLHNIQIQWITVLESRSRKLISTTELNGQKQIGDCTLLWKLICFYSYMSQVCKWWSCELVHFLFAWSWRFRDRDLKRLTQCHTASENFDAELLLNIRVSI